MVRLDSRLKEIKEKYVDEGSYFVINKGRQYGKTTTLNALEEYLKDDYMVLPLDFQLMGTEDFSDEASFCHAFSKDIVAALENTGTPDQEKLISDFIKIKSGDFYGLKELFIRLSHLCRESKKPIVLMIDEVDSASNNQVFVDFLSQLRGYYLRREKTPIFYSVILASVYNIKNLKLKLRPESEHSYNSPWNIAQKFEIDMSFSPGQIEGMLEEYEKDRHTGMDIQQISKEIYSYTCGYPVLVSAICKYIDEKLFGGSKGGGWSKEGVAQSVKELLKESAPLFESMAKQLGSYQGLSDLIEGILYQGRQIPFSPDELSVSVGVMFGFLVEKNGYVAIANRMFEMYLLNLFMTKEAVKSDVYAKGERDRSQFIKNGRLDMELVLIKFVEYFEEIYGENDMRFVEAFGRKFFLLYLKPIINGSGNYYLEAQTRDAKRTDVVVDYCGERFIVELKIWHGSEYHERGEKQLIGYLEYYHKKRGYLLSFNFNKNKSTGVKEIQIGDYTIIEAVV